MTYNHREFREKSLVTMVEHTPFNGKYEMSNRDDDFFYGSESNTFAFCEGLKWTFTVIVKHVFINNLIRSVSMH